MPVRSARLVLDVISSAGDWNLYTSPANVITLVKFLSASNNGGAAEVLFWYVLDPLTGNGARVTDQVTIAANASYIVAPWFVMEPGDELHAVTGTGPTHLYAAGAQLSQ